MDSWTPSFEYSRVVEANKKAYRDTAETYDKTETCVVSPRHQHMLAHDLNYIIRKIDKKNGDIQVLDACGGSGNVALKLLDKGIDVTLCDVSQELIDIFEEECKRNRYNNYTSICSDIGAFLSQTNEKYDLVVFSSCLHHILDYTKVLTMTRSVLRDGGFIYTVFDPVMWQFPAYQIIWIDWILHALTNYPRELFSMVYEKKNDSFVDYEYHVRSGIDDYGLLNVMQENGFRVVSHVRYTEARHRFFTCLLMKLRRPTNFKLLLQKK